MRHLITLACLAAALGMYYVGLDTGAGVAFAVAGVFEIVFWKRLFARRRAARVRVSSAA